MMFDNSPPPDKPVSRMRQISMSIAAAGSLLLLVSLHLGVLAITALAAAITVVGAVGVVRTQTKDGTGFGSTP